MSGGGFRTKVGVRSRIEVKGRSLESQVRVSGRGLGVGCQGLGSGFWSESGSGRDRGRVSSGGRGRVSRVGFRVEYQKLYSIHQPNMRR